MKVAMLGGQGRFDKSTGDGVPVYMHQIYTNLKKLGKAKKLKLDKVEYKMHHLLNDAPGWLYFVAKSAIDDYSGYDIVHTVDVKPFFPLNKGKAVYAVTGHDFQPLTAPELDRDMSSSLKGRAKLALEIRHSLRLALRADYMIAVSTLTRDDAVSLGYEKDRVFVVNHGIDEAFMAKTQARKAKGKYTVGYIGAFRTRKNVRFAIEGFKEVKDSEIQFDVWGKPAYEYDELRRLAVGDHRIRFKGFVAQSEMVNTYDTFDAFVFPTLYEGFGFPIIEAQARGLPVIIHKDAKIPEEVKRYCFKAHDKWHLASIIEELREAGYDERLRKRATDYARSFTWAKAAAKTYDAYAEMLE